MGPHCSRLPARQCNPVQAGAEPNGPILMHRNTGRNFFLQVLTISKGPVHQGEQAVVHQGGTAQAARARGLPAPRSIASSSVAPLDEGPLRSTRWFA
jgi:hypothetical protein